MVATTVGLVKAARKLGRATGQIMRQVKDQTIDPESDQFRPIVGTLAYLFDRSNDRVLMVRRNARPNDDQFGKMNGLGGKLEPDEDIVSGLRRELREEASVALTSLSLRGTVTWTNFGPKKQDWLAFIFLVDGWEGEIPTSNVEGSLEWIERSRLMQACSGEEDQRGVADLPMWAGDRYFVPLVFDSNPLAFHGTMPYDGDQPVSWSFERI